MKKLLSFVLLSVIFSACSFESENVGEEAGEVFVQVSLPGWEGVRGTRAGGGMLYPASVLVVPEGADEATKTVTLTEGTKFSLTLRDGVYDLWAICGLPTENLPKKLTDAVAIPDGENGKTDFAAGHTKLTVKNGAATPAELNVEAERQMAWLDVECAEVPSSVAELKFYVRGINDKFQFSNITDDGTAHTGWIFSSEKSAERYTQIALEREGDSYVGGGIMAPSGDKSGLTFIVEVTTKSGKKELLTYASNENLSAGKHLSLTISYDWLEEVGGALGVGEWHEDAADEEQFENFNFTIGQQYFSLPATVVNVSADGKSLNLMPHRPMKVTLAEVKEWDFKYVPYTLSPEINVVRWAFPTSETSMRNIIFTIGQIGWEAFDAQFTNNGIEPINRAAPNILAYRDKNTGKFQIYDFAIGEFRAILEKDEEDITAHYFVYPVGIVQIGE